MKSIYTSKSILPQYRNQKATYPIYGLYEISSFCFGINHIVNPGEKENSGSQIDLTSTIVKNMFSANIDFSQQKIVNRYSNISNSTFSTNTKNQL